MRIFLGDLLLTHVWKYERLWQKYEEKRYMKYESYEKIYKENIGISAIDTWVGIFGEILKKKYWQILGKYFEKY